MADEKKLECERTADEIADAVTMLDDVTGRRGALKPVKMGTRKLFYAKWAIEMACELKQLRAASTPEAVGRGEDCDNCGQWMPSGNPRVCGNCGMTRTLLPINERFTLYFDEEGDVIIECQRPNQFLASHGSTANEAVLDMRETLQLAASMRRPTGDKSPTEPTN